jgi:hypothetical protein
MPAVPLKPVDLVPKTVVIDPESVQIDPQNPLSGVFVPPAGCELVPQTARLGVRCTPEAIAWVKGLAAHCSLDVTSIIWQSLLRQAEASGYFTRIPQRYRRKPRRVTSSL